MTKRFFCILLLGLGLAKLPAAELKVSKQIDVWPGEVPGEKRDIPPESTTSREYRGESIQILSNVSKPTLTVYKPDSAKDTGASVVICPGGGYNILA
ncbi:MAG: alpha/beta hydrolase, partial [Verrucomicrobiota bacterium]|nr:alpha/beta hydrolase [Verrucomicrobiota bacterium]